MGDNGAGAPNELVDSHEILAATRSPFRIACFPIFAWLHHRRPDCSRSGTRTRLQKRADARRRDPGANRRGGTVATVRTPTPETIPSAAHRRGPRQRPAARKPAKARARTEISRARAAAAPPRADQTGTAPAFGREAGGCKPPPRPRPARGGNPPRPPAMPEPAALLGGQQGVIVRAQPCIPAKAHMQECDVAAAQQNA